MKKIFMLFLAFTCLMFTVTAQTMDKPVARVYLTKTEVITQTMVKHRLQQLQQMGAQITEAQIKEVLDLMITEILVSQAADRDKVIVTEAEILNQIKQQSGQEMTLEDLKKAIEAQPGVTYDAYIEQAKKQLVQQKYVTTKKQALIQGISTPSEAEISTFYEQNSLQFTNPEIVEFDHITYDIREKSDSEKKALLEEAKKLYIDISNNKTTIEDLIFKSQVSGGVNYAGGTKSHLAIDDKNKMMLFGNTFFDAVFKLNEGRLSNIIQSNVGYHIIKINKKYPKRFLSIDDPLSPENPTTVREYIRYGLYNQKQQQAFQQAVVEISTELREEAEVKIFEANLEW